MEYIEQTYRSIIFYFANKAVDQSLFNIISKHNFRHQDFDIEFGILTESHFISIASDSETITEICACKDYDIQDSVKLNIEDVIKHNFTKESQAYTYTFTGSVVDYTAGKKILEDPRMKQHDSETHYLSHTFPGRWFWSKSAYTEIYVTVGKTIITETVHTYPNERKMVFTKSEYETITTCTTVNI